MASSDIILTMVHDTSPTIFQWSDQDGLLLIALAVGDSCIQTFQQQSRNCTGRKSDVFVVCFSACGWSVVLHPSMDGSTSSSYREFVRRKQKRTFSCRILDLCVTFASCYLHVFLRWQRISWLLWLFSFSPCHRTHFYRCYCLCTGQHRTSHGIIILVLQMKTTLTYTSTCLLYTSRRECIID